MGDTSYPALISGPRTQPSLPKAISSRLSLGNLAPEGGKEVGSASLSLPPPGSGEGLCSLSPKEACWSPAHNPETAVPIGQAQVVQASGGAGEKGRKLCAASLC